jgi:bacterioferritin (cytochrome b1)
MFAEESQEELEHAMFFTEQLVLMGVYPLVEINISVEKYTNVDDMIALLLEFENNTIDLYTALAKEAERVGLRGLAVSIDSILEDEYNHQSDLQLMLNEDVIQ